MTIRLSDHFSFARLVRFTMPSMGMLIVTSLYTVADGFFVSNYVGKTAFVAVNLIFPFILIPSTLGTMLGTGGSALVAKTLGEGNDTLANSRFSLLVYFAIILGIILSLVWLPLLRPAAMALGADGEVLEACLLYGWILIPGLTPMILQFMFQSFFSLAEKPRLGMWITIAAGLANIIFDAFLIIIYDWGLAGAAIATVIGMLVGAIPPLIIFGRPNSSRLRTGRAQFESYAIIKSCTNGSSEFMTNISASIVAMLYNFQLLKMAGENGVAAFGVIMYISFIFVSIFLGYAFGVIPVVAYHFGAKNIVELKSILRKSLSINAAASILLAIAGVILSVPAAHLFVGYDTSLLKITEHACILYSFSFLFEGFNIFASSFFTALNNGLISAIIAFMRTFIFQLLAVLCLPIFFGVDGIWIATAAAEACALCVTLFCFYIMRKTYKYF